jgi:hypothetical protein
MLCTDPDCCPLDQRGWAAISSEHTFATGLAHALEAGTDVALCDPSVDSTIREGWPPTLGDVCPDCLSTAVDST